MQVVIDIPEDLYRRIKDNTYSINDRCDLTEIVQKGGMPLTKGHGKLIDADALIDSLGCSDRDIYCKSVIEEDAQTIIEADKQGRKE